MTPRPLLQFASPAADTESRACTPTCCRWSPTPNCSTRDRCCELFPLLRPEVVERGMYEPRAMGARRGGPAPGLRARGAGERHRDRPERRGDGARAGRERWTVTTRDGGRFAGAGGRQRRGRVGRRRRRRGGGRPASACDRCGGRSSWWPRRLGEASRELPNCSDVDEAFYANPEGAQFLCSPADETPCPPSDAKPDEVEIARAIEAINAATTLGVRSIGSSWAGLRTFAPDRNFVLGPDPEAPGLFWLAGQGGYGIQTAPATARRGRRAGARAARAAGPRRPGPRRRAPGAGAPQTDVNAATSHSLNRLYERPYGSPA